MKRSPTLNTSLYVGANVSSAPGGCLSRNLANHGTEEEEEEEGAPDDAPAVAVDMALACSAPSTRRQTGVQADRLRALSTAQLRTTSNFVRLPAPPPPPPAPPVPWGERREIQERQSAREADWRPRLAAPPPDEEELLLSCPEENGKKDLNRERKEYQILQFLNVDRSSPRSLRPDACSRLEVVREDEDHDEERRQEDEAEAAQEAPAEGDVGADQASEASARLLLLSLMLLLLLLLQGPASFLPRVLP